MFTTCIGIPVTAILADQLAVPSSTAPSAWSIESMCVSGSTLKITLNKKRKKEKHRDTHKTHSQSDTQTNDDDDGDTHCSDVNLLIPSIPPPPPRQHTPLHTHTHASPSFFSSNRFDEAFFVCVDLSNTHRHTHATYTTVRVKTNLTLK